MVIKEGDIDVSDSDDEDDSKYQAIVSKRYLLFLRECILNDHVCWQLQYLF